MRLLIDNLKQLKLKQTLLWLGTITLATVVLWIGYTIYSSYQKSVGEPSIQTLRKPLNPAIDIQTLDSLNGRIDLPETFTVMKTSNKEVALSENTPTPSPSATISATPVPEPIDASPSAESITDI